MKIERNLYPKSSFLSMEKDASLISNMLNPISDNNKRIVKNTLLLYFECSS